jgi:hypothetical protein
MFNFQEKIAVPARKCVVFTLIAGKMEHKADVPWR